MDIQRQNIIRNRVLVGDCIEVMKNLYPNSIDLIIADPPYGLRKRMNGDDMSNLEYHRFTHAWVKEAVRVLKSTGSIYVFGGIKSRSLFTIQRELDAWDLKFRNMIIWYYTGQGIYPKRNFSFNYDPILFYTKSDNFTFNLDSVREPYAKETIRRFNQGKWMWYGKPRRIHPKGKAPSNVWQIPRLSGVRKERVKLLPVQKPAQLIEKIVKVSSDEEDIILDPFLGTGVTAAIAKKYRRAWVGIEIDPIIASYASSWINKYEVIFSH